MIHNKLSDREILDTVHRWMSQSKWRGESEEEMAKRLIDCKDYIEQEWQRRDEE
jgi:hypothetical protein